MGTFNVFINLILILALFAIINYKLLKFVKYESHISKLSDGVRTVLSILFLATGYYLIMTRFNININMGIPINVILYISMLFISLGTKTYKFKPKAK